GGPRLIPNTQPAPSDWAHRGEVGNDNGYRYSLFSTFDYEVLKYSGRPARSGYRIVIALGRSPSSFLRLHVLEFVIVWSTNAPTRRRILLFIQPPSSILILQSARVEWVSFYRSCYINEGSPE
ncbi:hypothetical protein ALC62_09261, partial [Cyphomyrmex costatus]